MSIDQQQRAYRRASRSGSPEGLGAANGRSSKKYRMGDPEGLGGGKKAAGIPKLGGSGYQQFDEGVQDAYVADDFGGKTPIGWPQTLGIFNSHIKFLLHNWTLKPTQNPNDTMIFS